MNNLFSLSNFMFLASIGFMVVLIVKTPQDVSIKPGITIFSIFLLISSVIVHMKTCKSRWILHLFKLTLLDSLKNEGYEKEVLETIFDLLER